MAIKENDIVVIQDVVNYINSYLKQKIESKIQWNKENLPPNFDPIDAVYFASGNSLPNMPTPNNKGKIIDLQALYNSINAIFVSWGMVRKVTFHYRSAGYNNGGPIPWTDQYFEGYGYLSFISPNNVQGIMDNTASTGDIIRPLTLQQICDRLYSKWEEWSSQFEYQPYRAVCHKNCHGSCHGSGGRR